MSEAHTPTVGLATSSVLVPYRSALSAMVDRVEAIAAGRAAELVWLLEHPPTYTGGTRTPSQHNSNPMRFDYIATGRGGDVTYHGPGQRVAYVMLDVRQRFAGDVHAFVRSLETWVIGALDGLGIEAFSRSGRAGVWVADPTSLGGEAKIAALGLRIRRGISFHGISLNIDPNMAHYDGIVPCGLADYGVTSLAAQGIAAKMADADRTLIRSFETVFGAHLAREDSPLQPLIR
jgi:lipoyl(octanoyl) transferase